MSSGGPPAEVERDRLLAAAEAARAELELANHQLQEQATELEATTEELQATAAHLEEQVAARDDALRRLGEREGRFRQIAENVREVFWLTGAAADPAADEALGPLGGAADGPQAVLLYVSPAFADVWGRPVEVLRGNPAAFLEGVHPEDRPRVLAAWPTQPAGGYDITYRVVRPDGAVRWVRDRAYPVRDGDDPAAPVRRIAGVAEDVTAYRTVVAALGERERAAAASEARYRALAEAMPGVLFMTAPDGRNIYTNARFHAYAGLSADELLGDGWLRVIHPDDAARAATAWARAVATGGAYEVEYRFRRHDGRYRWFLGRALPYRDPETGAVAYWVGECTDIDDRRRAEAELRDREATLRGFTESAPVLMGLVELVPAAAADGPEELLHVYDNPATERFFGAPPGATAGRRASELGADRAVVDAWRRAYREALAQGAPVHFEYEYPSAQGRRWLSVTVAPVGPGVHGPRCSYVAEEVTTRKRAEAEGEHLRALTGALAAARTPEEVAEATVRAGVLGVGAPRGTVLRLTDGGATFELLASAGYAPEHIAPWRRFPNVAGLPGGDVVASRAPLVIGRRADYVARYPQLAAWMETSGYHGAALFPLVAGADPAAPVLGLMAFDFVEDRDVPPADQHFLATVAGLCAQALDRALAYQAEQAARAEAEQARGAAEAANRAKSEFLATMSHELRTPLNAIGGYAQLLDMGLHGPVTDDQRGALGRVQGAQRHLLGVINDILNFAKLEAGRVEYDVRPVDVRDVVGEVAPLVEPQFAAKGLAFDVWLPDGPCEVWADRAKLGQVLVNLLSNAGKFTDARHPATGAPGRVAVELTDDGAEPPGADGTRPAVAALRVTDTGRGIPPDKQEAVFEPFVQVQTGYTRAGEGTGLGLAISRDLARGMGGDLRVQSREGEGSTFTVTLRRVVDGAGAPTDRRFGRERRADGERRRGDDRRGT